jgi:two-component system phosphate regulon response regulator PhoB
MLARLPVEHGKSSTSLWISCDKPRGNWENFRPIPLGDQQLRIIVTNLLPRGSRLGVALSTSPRILVIEDEADLARSLEYNFRQAGFEVSSAPLGRDGVRLAAARPPDLVLLDLMLPDISGIEVCRQLKGDPRTRTTPIIILTAKGEEVDRVVGFEIGADDYVTKPFSVRELVLRVRAVLRRREQPGTAEAIRLGRLTIDPDAHRVHVEGREVSLTALEFRLLWTLVQRRDRVQTRETLLNDVWGLNLNVETRTIDTHIKRLREKLGKAGGLIETVRGVGYRFGDPEGEAV